jgi:hypothetical protein
MTDAEQRSASKEFASTWKGKGYEKGQSQPFWLSLLRDVYGVKSPEKYIEFEDKVHIDQNAGFIDGFIRATHVMIEQKGVDKDLRKPIKQSDGTLLTPFQQAKRYSAELPYSERPRWIITCNFKQFLVYDMENPSGEPEEILLSNLPNEYYRMQFLVDTGNRNIKREMEVSIQAGDLVGVLYDEILKQYIDPTNPESLKSLNMLCVRLVFCLYAEDAGIFGEHGKFHNYLESFSARDTRHALIDLFRALDTKPEDRDPYMDKELASFPYVNGGLFSDENIEIPQFNETICNLLLQNVSENFDWSEISPTIFGAVFESTLNPETRRSGGMHYTSIENIHKVIDPLFLDDLKSELAQIRVIPVDKSREKALREFQKKLSQLTFLDPACGSGNFLTETYLSLRRLENEVLGLLTHGQTTFGEVFDKNPIQVSIGQFYGIEINDFAVTVSRTALWIAESQMMVETENVIHMSLDFLPLKSYANIQEGNALQMDWNDVIPNHHLNYIMGNPPFVVFTWMKPSQKADLAQFTKAKSLDYVTAWYFKAAAYIQTTQIKVGFVSTNSIVQGEPVSTLWKPLLYNYKINIIFAYRTFVWNNEAKDKAAVHCVIIGFTAGLFTGQKVIFDNGKISVAENINPYLTSGDNIIVESRTKPLFNVPKMCYGNKIVDGGNLIIEEIDYENFIKSEPKAFPFIKKFIGSREFINRKSRYILDLQGVSPMQIRECPQVLKRVQAVKEVRLNSPAEAIRKKAATPMLFGQICKVQSTYIAVPRVSSQRRKYIPMDFLTPEIICSDRIEIIPDATLYHFGVLESNVHMAWMRATCMRLKSDYSYSQDIVYNNFPWPSPTGTQKQKIEATAQAILDARSLYPDSSLADLYDEVTMPPELRKAHQENDRAVMQAYGFSIKNMTESDCVAALMRLYQQKVAELEKQ